MAPTWLDEVVIGYEDGAAQFADLRGRALKRAGTFVVITITTAVWFLLYSQAYALNGVQDIVSCPDPANCDLPPGLLGLSGVMSSPIWGVIAAVAAVIAIPLAIFFYIKQRSVKLLVFSVGPAIPLLSIDPSIMDRLAITFEGKEVVAASAQTITVVNRGTSPIMRGDFDGPIIIEFSGVGLLLNVDAQIVGHSALSRSIEEGNKAIVAPFLLNKGEKASVSMLILDKLVFSTIQCRIAGGSVASEIQYENSSRKSQTHTRLIYATILVTFAMTVFATFLSYQNYRANLAERALQEAIDNAIASGVAKRPH